jgi:hypothetical protein
VVARFDGGRLSSEGGLLALREIERRLGLADRLAACVNDPRTPKRVRHRLAEIIRFRMLMNAAGYEDGNDADALRRDPMFKLALDRLPSAKGLSSHSTISRLGNLPDTRALLRLGRGLIEQYCASIRQVPKRIVLDVDDTFDRVYGGQQLRLSNAYHDDYGFQPIVVVFDGEGHFVTAVQRPGRREIRAFCAAWSAPSAVFGRGSRSYCVSAVIMPARSVRLMPGQPGGLAARPRPNAVLRRHVEALEKTTAERFKAAPTRGKLINLHICARYSRSRVDRSRPKVSGSGKRSRLLHTGI